MPRHDGTADGTVLVSGTIRGIQWGRVVRWNPATGAFTDFLPTEHASTAPRLARSADGGRAVASYDGDIYLLDGAETVRAETTPIIGYRLAGQKLHASGALLYVPHDLGVEISDAHTGARRVRIAAPVPLLDSLEVLAVDGTGRQIMALTQQGLWIAELIRAPLAVGDVTPGEVPAAPLTLFGDPGRIRGIPHMA